MKKMNHEEKLNLVNKVSRGNSQRELIYDLVMTGETGGLGGYMKTLKHYGNYITSYFNAVDRLEKAGLNIKYTPGKLGGYYSGYFQVV